MWIRGRACRSLRVETRVCVEHNRAITEERNARARKKWSGAVRAAWLSAQSLCQRCVVNYLVKNDVRPGCCEIVCERAPEEEDDDDVEDDETVCARRHLSKMRESRTIWEVGEVSILDQITRNQPTVPEVGWQARSCVTEICRCWALWISAGCAWTVDY